MVRKAFVCGWRRTKSDDCCSQQSRLLLSYRSYAYNNINDESTKMLTIVVVREESFNIILYGVGGGKKRWCGGRWERCSQLRTHCQFTSSMDYDDWLMVTNIPSVGIAVRYYRLGVLNCQYNNISHFFTVQERNYSSTFTVISLTLLYEVQEFII
jgi:hypothetical protein